MNLHSLTDDQKEVVLNWFTQMINVSPHDLTLLAPDNVHR
jgi:hypothetical protein